MKKLVKKVLSVIAIIIKKPIMKLRRTKKIVLYSHFITMDSHLMKYYDAIKDLNYNIKFVFFNYKKIDKERYKKLGINPKKVIKSKLTYLLSSPNVIVIADLNINYEFVFPCKTIFLGHGGSPTVNDYSGRDVPYPYGKNSVDKKGNPKYSIYYEANKYIIPIIEKNFNFKNKLIFTGNKYCETYDQNNANREKYRKELDISDNQKAIFIIGSWNKESLFHKLGKEFLDEIKKLAKMSEYKFIVSIHPREYIKYSDDVEPMGPYINELEKYGVIVKKPGTDMSPYIVSADLILCDYTGVLEECIICNKDIVLSAFECTNLYSESIGVRLGNKISRITNAKELLAIISTPYNEKYRKYINDIKSEVYAPKNYYNNICISTTQELLKK